MKINSPWGWSVDVKPEQAEAGRIMAANNGSRFAVWNALVGAGVPVRDASGRVIASLAATAIMEGA